MYRVSNIDIPDPCKEDWQKMTATDSGKYCSSCKKTVVNFTGMSDLEIVTYFSEHKNICGRFKKSQLNRTLNSELEKSIPTGKAWNYLMIIGFSGFVVLPNSNIKSQDIEKNRIALYRIEKDSLKETPITNYIKGIVLDSMTKEPIHGCSIIIIGHWSNTSTDSSGFFKLAIPDNLNDLHFKIQLSMVAYESIIVEGSDLINLFNKTFLMKSNEDELSGEVVVVYHPKKKWWQKLLFWK